MNLIKIASACVLLMSASVSVQQQSRPGTKGTELFKVPPYPSDTPWKEITNKKSERMELVEWIPADQSEDGIKDILTKQVFYSSKDQSAAAFVSGILKGIGQACERARVNGPKEQTENGYAVAYAQAYCTNQKVAAKDVDIFIKAIRGTDALYVVQREFRRPTQPGATPGVMTFSKEQVEEMKARLTAQSVADKFLVQQVQLCPLTDSRGACGQLETPGSSSTMAAPPASSPAPIAGPAPAAPSATVSATPFVEGKSTADEVKAALGKPVNEDHNPDGRFVYQYSSVGGDTIFAYLFDKNGVLIRIRGYKIK